MCVWLVVLCVSLGLELSHGCSSAVLCTTISVANTSVAETEGFDLTTGELAIIEAKFVVPNGTSSIDLVFSITPIPLDRHDTLEILNASVARLADMTVSGSQAIAISPNSTFPESITWSFPMLINPDGVGGINDTIQVQAVVVSAANDVLQLDNPQVTIKAHAVVNNVTIVGSSVEFQFVAPHVIASVITSLNLTDSSILVVTATVFHSNVSTAIAKNVILSIPLPSSVDIQRSDVDVAVTPGGLANPTANVIVAGNATTLILDIGDLPLTATVTTKFGISTTVVKDLGNGGIIPIVAYSSIDKSDQSIPGFPVVYPAHLVLSTTAQTRGSSSCIRQTTVYIEETDWTYDIAIIGCCVGFFVAALLTLLLFCCICRNRRHIPYNIFVINEQAADDEESRCQRSCCFSSRQSWKIKSAENDSKSTESLLRDSDEETQYSVICCGLCYRTKHKSLKAERDEVIIMGSVPSSSSQDEMTGVSPTDSATSQSVQVLQARYPTGPVIHSNSDFSLAIPGAGREDMTTGMAICSSEASCRTSSRLSNIKQAWRGGSLEQPDTSVMNTIDSRAGNVEYTIGVSNERVVAPGLDDASLRQGSKTVTVVTAPLGQEIAIKHSVGPEPMAVENKAVMSDKRQVGDTSFRRDNGKVETVTYTTHQTQFVSHDKRRSGSLVPIECRSFSISEDGGPARQTLTSKKIVPPLIVPNDDKDEVFDTTDGHKAVASPNSKLSVIGDELSLEGSASKVDAYGKMFKPELPGDLQGTGSDMQTSLLVGELHESFEGRPLVLNDEHSRVEGAIIKGRKATDTVAQRDDSRPELAAWTTDNVVASAKVTAGLEHGTLLPLEGDKELTDSRQDDGSPVLTVNAVKNVVGSGKTDGAAAFDKNKQVLKIGRKRPTSGTHGKHMILHGVQDGGTEILAATAKANVDFDGDVVDGEQGHEQSMGTKIRDGFSAVAVFKTKEESEDNAGEAVISPEYDGTSVPLESDERPLLDGSPLPPDTPHGDLQLNERRFRVNGRKRKLPFAAGAKHTKLGSFTVARAVQIADTVARLNFGPDVDETVLVVKGEHDDDDDDDDDDGDDNCGKPVVGMEPCESSVRTTEDRQQSSLSDGRDVDDVNGLLLVSGEKARPFSQPAENSIAKDGSTVNRPERSRPPTMGAELESDNHRSVLVGHVKRNGSNSSGVAVGGKDNMSSSSEEDFGRETTSTGQPLKNDLNRHPTDAGEDNCGGIPVIRERSVDSPSERNDDPDSERTSQSVDDNKRQTSATGGNPGKPRSKAAGKRKDNVETDKQLGDNGTSHERDRPKRSAVDSKKRTGDKHNSRGHPSSARPKDDHDNNGSLPAAHGKVGHEIGRPLKDGEKEHHSEISAKREQGKHSPLPVDRDRHDAETPSNLNIDHGHDGPEQSPKDKDNDHDKEHPSGAHDISKTKEAVDLSKPVGKPEHDKNGPLPADRSTDTTDVSSELRVHPKLAKTGQLPRDSSGKHPSTTGRINDYDKHSPVPAVHDKVGYETDKTGRPLMSSEKERSLHTKSEHGKRSPLLVDRDGRDADAPSKLNVGHDRDRPGRSSKDSDREHPSCAQDKRNHDRDKHGSIPISKTGESVDSSKLGSDSDHDKHGPLSASRNRDVSSEPRVSLPGQLPRDSSGKQPSTTGRINDDKHRPAPAIHDKVGYETDKTGRPLIPNEKGQPPHTKGKHGKRGPLLIDRDGRDADAPSKLKVGHDRDRPERSSKNSDREHPSGAQDEQKRERDKHGLVLVSKPRENIDSSKPVVDSDHDKYGHLPAHRKRDVSSEPRVSATGRLPRDSSEKQPSTTDRMNDQDKHRPAPAVHDKVDHETDNTGQPLVHNEKKHPPTDGNREHSKHGPLPVDRDTLRADTTSKLNVGNKHDRPERSPKDNDKGHPSDDKRKPEHDKNGPVLVSKPRENIDSSKPVVDSDHDKYGPMPAHRKRDVSSEPRVSATGRLPRDSSEKQPSTTDRMNDHDKHRPTPAVYDKVDHETDNTGQPLVQKEKRHPPTDGNREHSKHSPLPVDRDTLRADTPSKLNVGNKHDRPERSPKDNDKGHPSDDKRKPEHDKHGPVLVSKPRENIDSSKPVVDSDHDKYGPLPAHRKRDVSSEPRVSATGRLPRDSSEKQPSTTDRMNDHDKHRPAPAVHDKVDHETDNTGQPLVQKEKRHPPTEGNREHSKHSPLPVDRDRLRADTPSKLNVGNKHDRPERSPKDNDRGQPSDDKRKPERDKHGPMPVSKPKETVDSSKPVDKLDHKKHGPLPADSSKDNVDFSAPDVRSEFDQIGRLPRDSSVGRSSRTGPKDDHDKHRPSPAVSGKVGYERDKTGLPMKDNENGPFPDTGAHERERPEQTSKDGKFGLRLPGDSKEQLLSDNIDQHGPDSGGLRKGNEDTVLSSTGSPHSDGMTGRVLVLKSEEPRDGGKENPTTGDGTDGIDRNEATDDPVSDGALRLRLRLTEFPDIISQRRTEESVSEVSQAGLGDVDAHDINDNADVPSSAEAGQARVALKLRRRRKDGIPIGVLSSTTDVSIEGVLSGSETIPSNVYDTDNKPMPRGDSDNSHGNSALGLIKKKIVGLFSRSESCTPSKTQTGNMTPGMESTVYSGEDTDDESEGTEGEGEDDGEVDREEGEEIRQEEQYLSLSRAEAASPTLPKQRTSVVLSEWEIIISWLRNNPEEQQQELQSLDFLTSMRLDGELEQEESDMYIQLLVWFIQGLRKMGNLTVEQEAKLLVRFRFLIIQLTKKLTREKRVKFKEVARDLARKHKRQRSELDIKHYQERFQRSMKVEKVEEEGILAPCDGTAYMIGKFKVRIKQANPDLELNEGKDILMTDFLPWKKIDCRGVKVKKNQWIGSPIVQNKGMMGHKPTAKRRVTYSARVDTWHNSSSQHAVGTAARFSTDLRGKRAKHSVPAQLSKHLDEEKSATDRDDMVLLQKEQQSEKDNLEDDLRLQREEEAETLRKLFAAKRLLRIKGLTNKLLQEAASEASPGNEVEQEQFDRLRDQLAKAEIHIEQALDEEIARLRVSLMYRLRNREAMTESLNEERSYFNELDNLLKKHRDEAAETISDNDSGLEGIAELEAEVKEKIVEKEEYHQAALNDVEARTPRSRRTNLRQKQEEELDIFVKQQDEEILRDPSILENFVEWVDSRLTFLRKQREEREQLEKSLDEEARKQVSVLNEELNEFMEQVVVDQSVKLVALLSVQGKTDLNTASIGEEHIASLKQTKKERQQKLDNRRQQVKEHLQGVQAELETSRVKELEDRKKSRARVRHVISTHLDSSREDLAKFSDDRVLQLADYENRLTWNKLRNKRWRRAISSRQGDLRRRLEKKRRHRTLTGLLSGAFGKRQDTDIKIWRAHKSVIAKILRSRRLSLTREMANLDGDVDQEGTNGEESELAKQQNEDGLNCSEKDLERIIEEHKEGMERLGTALAKEREKQEESFAERLKKKYERKTSRSPMYTQDAEQLEEARKRLELESRHAIRDATEKAEQDLVATKQRKGLDLISRLVETGRYEESDLMDAMRKLFPSKSTAKLQAMLEKVRSDAALGAGSSEGTGRASGKDEDSRIQINVQKEAEEV